MNSSELQALRRLLFFSAAEAARYLAADEDRPDGVEERTWNRWEGGKMIVPANVAANVQQALGYRASAIHALEERLSHGEAGIGLRSAAVVWYAERDDWPLGPILWRPEQSAIAAVLSQHQARVHLVPFDARAFHAWRADREAADTPTVRGAWALDVSSAREALKRHLPSLR